MSKGKESRWRKTFSVIIESLVITIVVFGGIAMEEYKMDVDKNPDPAKGEALMRQQNELEKEIANLHGLIFKRGTVLKEVKKELTSAQVRLAEFNNLPKDAQLVVKAMEVIKAFDEDKLKLKPGDENEIDWIIGALSGCNGTTDVRKTLTALKANVEALAETPEVKARLIAAEKQRIAARIAAENAKRNVEAIKGALPRLNDLVKTLKAGNCQQEDVELVIKLKDKANELLENKLQLSDATVFVAIVGALANCNGTDDAISTLWVNRPVIRGMFPDNS